jgi:pimeloyl-ACP methyl ester carboxylesterase
MGKVTSADGTTIAFERIGSGPPLVLVDGAMCYRASGPMRPIAEALKDDFTVYTYDRRGRGESTDTKPYAVPREIEDLEALLAEAGGAAAAYAISSGAGLVLRAAAAGVPFTGLVLYEPPYISESDGGAWSKDYTARLTELLAEGRDGDAVALFMMSVGMPADAVAGMRAQPFWPVFEAIAPTLAYDNEVMGDSSVPRDVAAKITVPTLLLDGGDSPDTLRKGAKAAADAVPGALYRTLEGQTHDVSPAALAPAVVEFLSPRRAG